MPANAPAGSSEEREALAKLIAKLDDDGIDSYLGAGEMADAIIAAGFTRCSCKKEKRDAGQD